MPVSTTPIIACLAAASLSTAAWTLERNWSRPVSRSEASPASAPAPVNSPAPVVKALANKKLVASSDPQRLVITGANFAPDMTARLITPDGLIISYDPTSLEHHSASIVALTVPLENPGAYLLRVRSAADAISNEIRFEVGRGQTN